MKKITCLLLALVLVLGLAPAGFAMDFEEGELNNATWKLTTEGVLTVESDTLTGITQAPWAQHNAMITRLEISGKIRNFDENLIYNMPNLKYIQAYTTAGEEVILQSDESGVLYACNYDYDLERYVPYQLVALPRGYVGSYTVLENIPSMMDTFDNIPGLTALDFGATSSAPHALYAYLGSTNLKSVTCTYADDRGKWFNDEMGGLYYSALDDSWAQLTFLPSGLDSYTIPANLTLFYDQPMQSLSSAKNLSAEDGGNYTAKDGILYDGTTLEIYPGGRTDSTFVIPEDVTKLGDFAFSGAANLKEIWFQGGFVRFSDETFGDNALTCYYPNNDEMWEMVLLEMSYTNPDSKVNWVPYDPETEGPNVRPVTNPFTDVGQVDYYYQPVMWAVAEGITAGTSATTFSPEDDCTRAQVVTFLWRAAGEPIPTSAANPFTDVKNSDYFYNAVLWAVEKGITVGTSATTFGSEESCTRGQVATFLWRYAHAPNLGTGNPFTDVKADDYFAVPVTWAVSVNLTQGTSATTFSPEDHCTRGQIVTFLYRLESIPKG